MKAPLALGGIFVVLGSAAVLAGGAGGPAGGTRGRQLQQGGGCAPLYLPMRTQIVMDECCPVPPPLLPGEEPTPTSCDMPASCDDPACAHEFLSFFEDCTDRIPYPTQCACACNVRACKIWPS